MKRNQDTTLQWARQARKHTTRSLSHVWLLFYKRRSRHTVMQDYTFAGGGFASVTFAGLTSFFAGCGAGRAAMVETVRWERRVTTMATCCDTRRMLGDGG